MRTLPIKVNIPVALDLLDRTIEASQFIKANFQGDIAREVLHVVTTNAHENSGDPTGAPQNQPVLGIIADRVVLDNERKKALVIVGSRHLVADAFGEAARTTVQQYAEALAKFDGISDKGFDEAFKRFKGAMTISGV
jgi:hypothetical protein